MRGDGIVPVMEVGNNGGNSGFGGYGNGDWAWIIVLFLIFGWGRNGFGGGFGGNSGIGENAFPRAEKDCLSHIKSRLFGRLFILSRFFGLTSFGSFCQTFRFGFAAFITGMFGVFGCVFIQTAVPLKLSAAGYNRVSVLYSGF